MERASNKFESQMKINRAVPGHTTHNLPATFLYSLLATILVGGLFYYWFAVADRYFIFLYNHMGATPFTARTISRYWMAGFVAGGVVLVVTVAGNWYAGRLTGLFYRRYQAPIWWQVWLLTALPLGLLICWITIRLNQPTLPPGIALRCMATALSALALALTPTRLAAERPRHLAWIALLGAGLVPPLLLLRVIELPAQGLASWPAAYGMAGGSLLVSGGWLLSLIWLGHRWMQPIGQPWQWWLAGLGWSFLILPLFHYLVLTPSQYRYITVADNFFAGSILVQLVSLAAAWLLAFGAANYGRHQPQTYLTGEN